jgi:HD-like signal output (HDOD) protein
MEEAQNFSIEALAKSNAVVALPPCPGVFVQLSQVLSDPDSPPTALAEVLSADQALCTQVLRLANSVSFGMTRRVASIQDAVFRIGYQHIWMMSVALKSREMMDNSTKKWSAMNEQFWKHGFKAGVFARFLGRHLNPAQASTFFTAGLLHDLGKWVLLNVAPKYEDLCSKAFGPELVAQERTKFTRGGAGNVWRHERKPGGAHER